MNWTIRKTLIVSLTLLCVTVISVAEASADWRLRGARCRGVRVARHNCCTNHGYQSQGYYAGHNHSSGNGYYGAAYSQPGVGGYMTNHQHMQYNGGCNPTNVGTTGVYNNNTYGTSQPMTNGQTWSSGQINQNVQTTTNDQFGNPIVIDQKQNEPNAAPTDNLNQNLGGSKLPIDKD